MPILTLGAKIGVDGRGFKAGLREAQIATNQFASSVRSQLAAAFSVAAATAFLRNIADTVSRIKDLSDQYGITTDEVQRADVALKKNGLAFEDLGSKLQKLGDARRDAVEGNEDLRGSFARYGVTLQELNDPQRRNYDLILKIADAIRGQNLTARDQVELTDLLGRGSLKLITTLQTLRDFDGIELFKPEDIKVIDDANKKLEEMIRKTKVLAASGIVEGSKDPVRVAGDYLRTVGELFPSLPGALGLNAAGQAIENPDLLKKIPLIPGLPGLLKTLGTALEGVRANEGVGPPSTLDVVNANIEKSNRLNAEANKGVLFELDKDKKLKAPRKAKFDVDRPGGFGAGAGFSRGFLNAFDPRMVVEQGQLEALESIRSDVSAIKNGMSTGGNQDP